MQTYILFLLFAGSDLLGFEGHQYRIFQQEEGILQRMRCAEVLRDESFVREVRKELHPGLSMRVQCVRNQGAVSWGAVDAERVVRRAP